MSGAESQAESETGIAHLLCLMCSDTTWVCHCPEEHGEAQVSLQTLMELLSASTCHGPERPMSPDLPSPVTCACSDQTST